MNSSAPFGSAIALLACAALVACATAEPPNPEPVRTPPPRAYEKTIHNYLAFKVRPPKNAEINVGQPEPGACPLDGQLSSARGWVVPVAYATRTGEPTGRQVVYITSKQYYFWFLGDTIAGVTPRIELCPGLVATFSEGARPASAALPEPSITAPSAASKADAQRRDSAAASKQSGPGRATQATKVAGSAKHGSAAKTRKTGASPHATSQTAKKGGDARPKVESQLKKPGLTPSA